MNDTLFPLFEEFNLSVFTVQSFIQLWIVGNENHVKKHLMVCPRK